ncbi:acyl-CoA thioesterase [Solitalea sp. MAHUQ-68]|uniref:Acyl-CoA thioesterase n=1 Tax=Solitalea agri TaxID=2953739 RepID=A0A9X2JDQ4_9SPHI|nr:acyl-CoA thioesterase [Solitalea agri]MCO4291611.1 acyl-CoA thioesterase [Solitalea agri]
MREYSIPVSIRWADLDPNFHVRHSAYYDFGAQARINFFVEKGLTAQVLAKHHFGPVLFREEAVFRRELKFGDKLSINVKVLKLKKDHSRFSIAHEIIREDGTLCAKITVDGAWMDTHIRKLTLPPQIAIDMLVEMPKDENFEWID